MAHHSNVNMRRSRLLALALGAASLPPIASARAADAPRVEPLIAAKGAEGDYLRLLHRDIHFRWAVQFLEGVAAKRPANDPINNSKLEAEVLFTVRWDGSP